MTNLTHQFNNAESVPNFPDSIPIVFGGVHATLLPEQSLAHDGIDVVVKGEAATALSATPILAE